MWAAASLAGIALLVSACGVYNQGTQALGMNGDVQVSLEMDKTWLAEGDEVVVRTTFTNTSAQPVKLLDWNLPGSGVRWGMFEVLLDGVQVEYQGAHIKFPAEPQESDFVTLEPGASLTRTMVITDMYDLSKSGNYLIRYAPGATDEAIPGQATVLQSNDVSVWIAGRLNPRLAEDDMGQLGLSFTNCTSTQQSTATTAVNNAKTYSTNSYNYLANTTPSGTPRYTTWFGSYTSTRWTTVKNHFNSIKNAFNNQAVVVDCSCTSSAYAYVYKGSPYKIYVCNAFWSAPMTGTDSKAGTLVHEMSHFTVVADTDDWAYGHSACKSLATSNPTNAVDNADSHEYFAENTPVLN